MNTMLTIEKFALLKEVGVKYDTRKLQAAIDSAEEIDLKKLLGSFYFDLINNYEEDSYLLLMSGGNFVYEGEQFNHDGILKLIAEYAYARYIPTAPVNFGAFGIVTKTNNDSTPVSAAIIKGLVSTAENDAKERFNTILLYLQSEPILFKRFGENIDLNPRMSSLTISKL